MRSIILLFVFLGFGFAAYGQLSISGKITLSPEWQSKLYLIRIDRLGLHSPILVDSIALKPDGSFAYTFEPNPQGILYELRLPPKDGSFKTLISGFNDNWFHVISAEKKELITIFANSDSLYYSLKIEERGINKELLIFQKFKKPIANSIRQMTDSIKRFPLRSDYFKDKYLKVVFGQLDVLKMNVTGVLDTCKSTPLMLAGLYYLNEAHLGQISGAQIAKYSNHLTNENILLVRNLKRNKESIERNRIGSVLPNVSFYDIRGKQISLNSIRAKYKVIDFWASWCSPCRYANKNQLPQLYEYLIKLKVPLLAITIDEDQQKWENAVKKDKTSWSQYREPGNLLSKFLDVGAIPLYIIVDESNVVVLEATTTFQVESFLEAKLEN